MEISRHVNDQEQAELLSETAICNRPDTSTDCCPEPDFLQDIVGPLPGALLVATDHPEIFWYRQQAEIRSRIAIGKVFRPPIWGFLVAAAVALTALAVLALRPTPVSPVRHAQIDSDDELLVAVEQAVESEVPYALAPASLLSEDTATESSIQRSLKENSNANY